MDPGGWGFEFLRARHMCWWARDFWILALTLQPHVDIARCDLRGPERGLVGLILRPSHEVGCSGTMDEAQCEE